MKVSNKNTLRITVLSNANAIDVLSFNVQSVVQVAKIYQDTKKGVKEIRKAVYNNNSTKGTGKQLTEADIKSIYDLYLQEKTIENIQTEHEKHFDSLINNL